MKNLLSLFTIFFVLTTTQVAYSQTIDAWGKVKLETPLFNIATYPQGLSIELTSSDGSYSNILNESRLNLSDVVFSKGLFYFKNVPTGKVIHVVMKYNGTRKWQASYKFTKPQGLLGMLKKSQQNAGFIGNFLLSAATNKITLVRDY